MSLDNIIIMSLWWNHLKQSTTCLFQSKFSQVEREFLFPTVFITFCGDIVKQQLHGQLPSTTWGIKIFGVKACARKLNRIYCFSLNMHTQFKIHTHVILMLGLQYPFFFFFFPYKTIEVNVCTSSRCNTGGLCFHTSNHIQSSMKTLVAWVPICPSTTMCFDHENGTTYDTMFLWWWTLHIISPISRLHKLPSRPPNALKPSKYS